MPSVKPLRYGCKKLFKIIFKGFLKALKEII